MQNAKKTRTLSHRQRIELSGPVMAGAALNAARDQFRTRSRAIADEIRRLLAGRTPWSLEGPEAVRFLSLMLRAGALAVARKHHAEAFLAARFGPETAASLLARPWNKRAGKAIQRG